MGRGRIISSSSSSRAVAFITVSLVCVVALTNVYVPYFSPEAVAGRERTSRSGPSGGVEAGPVAGSVWKNIGKQRDALKDGVKKGGDLA